MHEPHQCHCYDATRRRAHNHVEELVHTHTGALFQEIEKRQNRQRPHSATVNSQDALPLAMRSQRCHRCYHRWRGSDAANERSQHLPTAQQRAVQ